MDSVSLMTLLTLLNIGGKKGKSNKFVDKILYTYNTTHFHLVKEGMELGTIMFHQVDFFYIDSNCTKICKFVKTNQLIA